MIHPDVLELQRQYNALMSAEIERIECGLVMGIGWLRVMHIPWWCLDLRLQDWMEEWDERFASRYARS